MHYKVVMLPVGQGAMNLIEVYEDDDLVNLTLIDCGSADRKKYKETTQACEQSLNYALEKMKERFDYSSKEGKHIHLDNLLLTHRDSDHWSLLEDLFRKVLKEKEELDETQQICWLQREKTNNDIGYIETYYVNRKEWTCTYRVLCVSDVNMKLEIKYKMIFEPGDIYSVSLKFKTNKMLWHVTWLFSCLCVKIIRENEILPWCSATMSLFRGKWYVIYKMAGGKNTETFEENEVSRNYEGFCLSFAHIYEVICFHCSNAALSDTGWYILNVILSNVPATRIDVVDEVRKSPDSAMPFIEKVYIGGNEQQEGTDYLRMEETVRGLSVNGMCYPDGIKDISLYSNKLHLLVWKCVDPQCMPHVVCAQAKADCVQNNATSLVSVLRMKGDDGQLKAVFSGDATVHTFYNMLTQLDILENYKNAVWTAPHHGAYSTLCGKFRRGNTHSVVEVFEAFLQAVTPQKVIVSAGYRNVYGHPCENFEGALRKNFSADSDASHWIYKNQTNSKEATWIEEEIRFPYYTMVCPEPQLNGKFTYSYQAYEFPEPTRASLLLEQQNTMEAVIQRRNRYLTEEIPAGDLFFHRN